MAMLMTTLKVMGACILGLAGSGMTCQQIAAQENIQQSVMQEGYGFVLLLNGTSSAGKSTIIKELQRQSNQAFDVVSLDTFPYVQTYYDYEGGNAKFLIDFYTHGYNLAKQGRKVIIDTVEYTQDDYKTYDAIFENSCFKVLVYCPLHQLIERVEKRNNSATKYEHRTMYQALYQFVGLYSVQNSIKDVVIDRVSFAILTDMLAKIHAESIMRQAQKASDDTYDYLKDDAQLPEKCKDQFCYCDNLDSVAITSTYPWDVIVNSGNQSSTAAAQEIMNFLQSQSCSK